MIFIRLMLQETHARAFINMNYIDPLQLPYHFRKLHNTSYKSVYWLPSWSTWV